MRNNVEQISQAMRWISWFGAYYPKFNKISFLTNLVKSVRKAYNLSSTRQSKKWYLNDILAILCYCWIRGAKFIMLVRNWTAGSKNFWISPLKNMLIVDFHALFPIKLLWMISYALRLFSMLRMYIESGLKKWFGLFFLKIEKLIL